MAEIKERCKCRICGDENATMTYDTDGEREYLICPICGKYILPFSSTYLLNEQYKNSSSKVYDKHKLTSYLFYNKVDKKYSFIGTESTFEQYMKNNPLTEALLVTPEMVENWYPITFSERIDKIMLYLNQKTGCIGEILRISYINLLDVFFIDTKSGINAIKTECSFSFISQINYYLNYLSMTEQIKIFEDDMLPSWSKIVGIQITPKGFEKIYDLLKTQAKNKNVFIAMRFGDATHELREKIKEGIRLAGYEPRIMDEIEHNHQIVPEMLYEIKNSRFVVAELSHHNNGAYYEAGYAYGLNKEVIHICSEEALKNELHFDVAQINTITYADINEIPEKLKNRIQATIV